MSNVLSFSIISATTEVFHFLPDLKVLFTLISFLQEIRKSRLLQNSHQKTSEFLECFKVMKYIIQCFGSSECLFHCICSFFFRVINQFVDFSKNPMLNRKRTGIIEKPDPFLHFMFRFSSQDHQLIRKSEFEEETCRIIVHLSDETIRKLEVLVWILLLMVLVDHEYIILDHKKTRLELLLSRFQLIKVAKANEFFKLDHFSDYPIDAPSTFWKGSVIPSLSRKLGQVICSALSLQKNTAM